MAAASGSSDRPDATAVNANQAHCASARKRSSWSTSRTAASTSDTTATAALDAKLEGMTRTLASAPDPITLELEAENDRLEASIADRILARSGLGDRIRSIEQHLATPMPSPPAGATGDPEYDRLIAEASVADVLDAAIYGRRVEGATRELQAEHALGEQMIPVALLDRQIGAAASSVTAAGGVEHQAPTMPQVFASVMTERFGVRRRMAPVGITKVPVVTAPDDGPTSTATVGTDVADSDVTIVAHELAPQPLTVTALLSKTDLASFAGLEADVTRTLRDSISNALDYQALLAPGAGIMTTAADPNPTAGTQVVNWQILLTAVYAAIDGRYAESAADLRVLSGPDTYRLGIMSYRANQTDISAVHELDMHTDGVSTSALVPAPASDNQQAVIARGGHQGSEQCMWGGVEVISDRLTTARANQVRVTLSVLQDTALVRPEVYRRAAFHLA